MHSLKENLYYIWKKLSEKQSRKKFDEHFKDDTNRFKQCSELKPAAQIARETKELKKYWGCYPYQYYRFDFYRNDCTISSEEMKKYVPNFFIYSLFFPLSFKDYGILCEDKGLTYTLLKGYNITQPKMLFRFDKQKFYDEQNTPITDDEVDDLINASKALKLFIKPSFGLGGRGIIVFKTDGNNFINEQNTKLDHSFFRNEIKDGFYVIQEGIMQHEVMNKLYPHSVNTFRIITECINGESRVVYSLVRMGQGGKQVDNASSGGLYIKIDPYTGVLADFAYTHNRITFDAHPDTNFIYKNARIEKWEEAKSFALQAAKKFREIKYLGWDVAFSENGPLIIEINNGPDIELIQDFYGGMRDDLHIKPNDWWYNSKYTIRNL